VNKAKNAKVEVEVEIKRKRGEIPVFLILNLGSSDSYRKHKISKKYYK